MIIGGEHMTTDSEFKIKLLSVKLQYTKEG